MTATPGPVVEHFNVPGQNPDFIDTFSDPFYFQRTEERFGHRIISVLSTAAQTRCQVIGPAEALPVVTAELTALVRMRNDLDVGFSPPHDHPQRILRKLP